MKDIKSRCLAKYLNSISKTVHMSPEDRTWSQEEVSLLLKDSIAHRALDVNIRQEQLLG